MPKRSREKLKTLFRNLWLILGNQQATLQVVQEKRRERQKEASHPLQDIKVLRENGLVLELQRGDSKLLWVIEKGLFHQEVKSRKVRTR